VDNGLPVVQMIFLDKDSPGIETGGQFSHPMSHIKDVLLHRGYLGGQLPIVAGMPEAQLALQSGKKA
jgi:hypothetical protein